MRIVVNHLTRMKHGFICVAGVDPSSGKHVRPVMNGRLPRTLLAVEGGPFDIALEVDLGTVRAVGNAPEVEDHQFYHWSARATRTVPGDEFWALLAAVSRAQLRALFGDDLYQEGATCVVDAGAGCASLGCLMPAARPYLTINSWGTLRMRVNDGVFDVSLPVTDLRLFADDHTAIRRDVLADMNRRLARGVPVILSVGLSRPFRKSERDAERHWLQVNGIHLADREGGAERSRRAPLLNC